MSTDLSKLCFVFTCTIIFSNEPLGDHMFFSFILRCYKEFRENIIFSSSDIVLHECLVLVSCSFRSDTLLTMWWCRIVKSFLYFVFRAKADFLRVILHNNSRMDMVLAIYNISSYKRTHIFHFIDNIAYKLRRHLTTIYFLSSIYFFEDIQQDNLLGGFVAAFESCTAFADFPFFATNFFKLNIKGSNRCFKGITFDLQGTRLLRIWLFTLLLLYDDYYVIIFVVN